MSNGYFTNPNNLLPTQRATAASVSGDFDLVEQGFNKLPAPDAFGAGKLSYSLDTGSVNALAATLSNPPASLVDGLLVAVKAANMVTGPATLNVNGMGAKPLLRPDGTALAGGDIQAGQFFDARYNADLSSFLLCALNLYPLAGAAMAPTMPNGDNSTRIANTSYVQRMLSSYLGMTGLGGYPA